ncbi:flagellar hook-length control protein FliK [Butyrivibrio sp. JL13D10]|uniref:flagellar hook-length control protein FliK n=1 Tax=Butyrivibrio sp. JL13D10 TaxID=3236815 RepID=UPI0038B41FE6
MSIIQNLNLNRPVVQVDGRVVNQNASESQESLRNLETGERLSGKIISMTDEGGVKNAQIRLGDDVVISAKLQDGMYLKEGQTISFEVRGVSNQITLTPLYENTSIDPTTLKALNAAGIEVNQDTVNMVRSMMENGMGIDRDSLNSMHQIINSNPGTDTTTLVQMKALDIPITDQNIAQFESYKNYEHQVVETMNSIMDELPESYNQLVQSGEGRAALDLYGGILEMLSEGAQKMEEMAVSSEGSAATMQTMAESEPVVAETLTEAKSPLITGREGSEEVMSGDGTGQNEDAVKTDQALNKAGTSGINSDGELLPDGTVKATDSETVNKEAGNTNTDKPVNPDMQTQNNENGVVKNDSPKINLSNEFANIIKELNANTGTTGPEIQKLLMQAKTGVQADIDQTALLKELAEAYTSSAHTSEGADKALAKLFGNSEYNKLMKNIMQDEWLLKPDDVSLKENVRNLYERLNSQAKQLTQQLTQALGADSKAAQSAASLQNNIDFMNQLNQMFHYVQLPLKMADQDAHGDLYVYSNGRKKFEPGDTVSAILHLDMDNLGPLDVYVKMKDKNVKTNFYVADESIIDLIAEHIDELTARLNKRGYNMEAKMMLHTEQDMDSEDPPVEAILDAKKTGIISVASFDARA